MSLKSNTMKNTCLNMARTVGLSIVTVYVIYPCSLDPFVLMADFEQGLIEPYQLVFCAFKLIDIIRLFSKYRIFFVILFPSELSKAQRSIKICLQAY